MPSKDEQQKMYLKYFFRLYSIRPKGKFIAVRGKGGGIRPAFLADALDDFYAILNEHTLADLVSLPRGLMRVLIRADRRE
jgi:hypothetical protein